MTCQQMGDRQLGRCLCDQNPFFFSYTSLPRKIGTTQGENKEGSGTCCFAQRFVFITFVEDRHKTEIVLKDRKI